MARGRMVSNKICLNKKVHELSDDTSRLAFTWLITFGDAEGRTYGDPAVIRSMLFPRRTDITVEQMEGYVKEWHTAGLIEWYEADGDRWIYFPKFAEHQKGFDRRHEPLSTIPTPEEGRPVTIATASSCPENILNNSRDMPIEGSDIVRTLPVQSTEAVRVEHGQSTAELNRIEKNIANAERSHVHSLGKVRTSAGTSRNEVRAALEEHFILRTMLPPPARNTTKQKKEAGQRWWSPLRQIAELCEWDIPKAKDMIDAALKRMEGLTISAPQSILKTAIAIAGEHARGEVRSRDGPAVAVGPGDRWG